MADDIIRIQADTYRAHIALNQLPGLTLAKYRRLLRLMLDYRSDNQEALKRLGVWLAKYERRTVNLRSKTKAAKLLEIYQSMIESEEPYNGYHNSKRPLFLLQSVSAPCALQQPNGRAEVQCDHPGAQERRRS